MFAFVFPLLGLAASLLLRRFKRDLRKISLDLLDISVATFTLGSLSQGVLEIYGTANRYVNLFLYAGIILTVLFIVSLFVKKS